MGKTREVARLKAITIFMVKDGDIARFSTKRMPRQRVLSTDTYVYRQRALERSSVPNQHGDRIFEELIVNQKLGGW